MEELFAKVKYSNVSLHDSVKKDADKKFGSKNSYVKNLWILREYRKRGGKSSYKGKKPSNKNIQKQIKASSEVDINDSFWNNIDEYED